MYKLYITYIFDLFRHSYCDLHCQTRHITYSRFHLQRSSSIISVNHYLSSYKLVTISHAPSLLIFHFNNHFPSNSNCFTTALDCWNSKPWWIVLTLIPDFADRELLPGDFGTFGLEFWGFLSFSVTISKQVTLRLCIIRWIFVCH